MPAARGQRRVVRGGPAGAPSGRERYEWLVAGERRARRAVATVPAEVSSSAGSDVKAAYGG